VSVRSLCNAAPGFLRDNSWLRMRTMLVSTLLYSTLCMIVEEETCRIILYSNVSYHRNVSQDFAPLRVAHAVPAKRDSVRLCPIKRNALLSGAVNMIPVAKKHHGMFIVAIVWPSRILPASMAPTNLTLGRNVPIVCVVRGTVVAREHYTTMVFSAAFQIYFMNSRYISAKAESLPCATPSLYPLGTYRMERLTNFVILIISAMNMAAVMERGCLPVLVGQQGGSDIVA